MLELGQWSRFRYPFDGDENALVRQGVAYFLAEHFVGEHRRDAPPRFGGVGGMSERLGRQLSATQCDELYHIHVGGPAGAARLR